MPLTMINQGKKVFIVDIQIDTEFRKRLADMGLIHGAGVDVIQNSSTGPFIIGIKGSRIMLDYKTAEKIIVEQK